MTIRKPKSLHNYNLSGYQMVKTKWKTRADIGWTEHKKTQHIKATLGSQYWTSQVQVTFNGHPITANTWFTEKMTSGYWMSTMANYQTQNLSKF